jgi:NAD-dependent DNA ligase adenylation domain
MLEVSVATPRTSLPTVSSLIGRKRPPLKIEHHARWTIERDALDDEIDGIVIMLDDLKDRERHEAIAQREWWAVAYKGEPRREVIEKGGHSDGERRDRPRAQ